MSNPNTPESAPVTADETAASPAPESAPESGADSTPSTEVALVASTAFGLTAAGEQVTTDALLARWTEAMESADSEVSQRFLTTGAKSTTFTTDLAFLVKAGADRMKSSDKAREEACWSLYLALASGGITPDEAKDLYGVSKGSISQYRRTGQIVATVGHAWNCGLAPGSWRALVKTDMGKTGEILKDSKTDRDGKRAALKALFAERKAIESGAVVTAPAVESGEGSGNATPPESGTEGTDPGAPVESGSEGTNAATGAVEHPAPVAVDMTVVSSAATREALFAVEAGTRYLLMLAESSADDVAPESGGIVPKDAQNVLSWIVPVLPSVVALARRDAGYTFPELSWSVAQHLTTPEIAVVPKPTPPRGNRRKTA